MPIRLVVMQPTSLCNLNCRYCYISNRQDATKMSDVTLEAAFSKILRSHLIGNAVEFLWHAGEPLTAGLPFYLKAMELITHYNEDRLVHNSVQTNATLVSPEWCEFFARHKWNIGVSIDGPAFLHDQSRRNWGGRGTHVDVMRGVRLLREHNLLSGALCVLTRQTLNHPDEVFDFFYQNGFRWVGFNVEEIENANQRTSLLADNQLRPSEVVTQAYRNFMSRFFDRWWEHRSEMDIREFKELAGIFDKKLADLNYYRCPDEVQPLTIITIQKNGDITTNSPEFAGGRSAEFQDFVVGNIRTISELENILDSDVYVRLQLAIHRSVQACASTCLYFDLCGGGLLSNKYFENGSLLSTETTTCILHRQVLAEVMIEKATQHTDSHDGGSPLF